MLFTFPLYEYYLAHIPRPPPGLRLLVFISPMRRSSRNKHLFTRDLLEAALLPLLLLLLLLMLLLLLQVKADKLVSTRAECNGDGCGEVLAQLLPPVGRTLIPHSPQGSITAARNSPEGP